MKPTEFKKLQREWYAKLKEEGFVDLEDKNHDLKQWETSRFLSRKKGYNPKHPELLNDSISIALSYFSKAEYYRLVSGFLYEHTFSSDEEKWVWEQHSEGLVIREIESKAKQLKMPKLRRDKLHKIINKLKKIMIEKAK